MTLQNGLLTPEAAYLWSETGLFSWEEKQLVGHDPRKVFTLPGRPWALVHSGTSDVWEAVEAAICEAQPVFLGPLVMCIQSAMAAHLNHDWPGGQRVLIAGYEDGPHLYLVTTEAIGGYPPLAPLPIRTHMISGRSEAIDRQIAKGVTLDSMGRIIRAQHADCLLEGNWPLAGKVTRARVSAEGVELVEVDELPVPVAIERAA